MWIEYRYEDGSTWQGCPDDQTHELKIWAHEKEGFSWRVLTADVDANTPEGWSATLEDAKRHAEQAYNEWVEEHDETAEIVAEAVAQERAAVLAYLHHRANLWLNAEKVQKTEASIGVWLVCQAIERGEHRRKEGA